LYSTLLGIRGQEKALSGYGRSSSDDEDEDTITSTTSGKAKKDLKKMLSAAGWAQTTGLEGLMGGKR
jgi:hypothetical protein